MFKKVRPKTKSPHKRDKIRDIVLELWSATRKDWGFLSGRIAQVFRRESGLGPHACGRVVDTLHGMIQQSCRIDFALSHAVKNAILEDDLELAQYLTYRLLAKDITLAEAEAELPNIKWATVEGVDERIARESDPLRRLVLLRSLPDWFAARLLLQYGTEADALATALNQRAPLTLRINLLKTTRSQVAVRLAKEKISARDTVFGQCGLVLENYTNVYGMEIFQDGWIEVQDEASQLVAELVAAAPRSTVIDACAGAGGKTLALGVIMKNTGRLIALDSNAHKLDELRRRARRAGLHNFQGIAISRDQNDLKTWHGQADRVLVDVPCSGTGALRHNPESRWRLSEQDIQRLSAEQEAIARGAMPLCKPGGRLIYATCSVLAEENEQVVERLLATSPEFQLVPIKEILGNPRAAQVSDGSGRYLRMLPHRHNTDGFFAAVLRRKPVTK